MEIPQDDKQRSKLVKICRELDPFGPIPPESEKVLRNFGIEDFSDPFTITKELLKLLDLVDEKKH
ncbi:MAG: hypothetical protein DRQ88_11645 [Epsilonproteobacteria bacterium]|nr:MAG: hypothetical protein DRQ89_08070 [Campylobacterota bacterium]RLA64039.1 MAG: hypothetical protein DRQ88_11645 [Campylobacterota bacterium]